MDGENDLSLLTAPSYLESNLGCLGARCADLAERLSSVPPAESIEFTETPQGVPAATLTGRQLCSRQRPLDEAARQTDQIDLVEHAAVVVLGFGLGYHVQRLAERSRKATLIIVFEPDLPLLRSVLERIDHSEWMKDALLLFVTDSEDRGALAKKLEGAESILAQGVHFFEHIASRERLAAVAPRFMSLFTECISAGKTTLMTTLMRSVDTTRNLMLNIDHYSLGSGISDLHNVACGSPAVIVSAGPSLHRNMHLLKQPGVRDRCVIIAVQTTLKPLLAAGITPHFVTALDYHEISKRFYEDLRPDDVRDVTLVVDPKAHPVILDSYPGPIRCCANEFLDKVLGELKHEMGELPPGATVAHLAVYLAKFIGCNPIALIGQDLGFTDGLYYAPRAAIHDVWAPELNPFNTIEMMEWQRIARHRLHLKKVRDMHGRSIYTDAQMDTYLHQFERDFAQYTREGLTIVDASEGGVAKQHTTAMPLATFIERSVMRRPVLANWTIAKASLNPSRSTAVRKRLAEVRGDVVKLHDLSRDTAELLQRMLADQHDLAAMSRHFEKVEHNRKEVEQRFKSFELLNALNQLGVFKRMKADRRMHMCQHLSPVEKQRAQLERDLVNVNWIADAAQEMLEQLESADQVLADRTTSQKLSAVHFRKSEPTSALHAALERGPSRIAALIPIDPQRNGLGVPRSLAEPFHGKSVLQATLERLGRSNRLDSIILISPQDFDVDGMIDHSRIDLPLEVERVAGSPFGPEHTAIAAARLWADTCWRGGIAGMSIYDEVLCPQVMWLVMQQRGLTTALIVGPDWPLVQVTEPGGCDAVIARHLQHPQQHNLVFTQSPPGLCGCLVSATLMQELSQRNRLSAVGGLLVYQPHAPQGDPIARDVNVQIDHTVRNSLIRATFDSPRQHARLQTLTSDQHHAASEIVASLNAACGLSQAPQHITLELCTDRTSRGRFHRHPFGTMSRIPISMELATRLFQHLAAFDMHDLALTLDGVGDPLLHPHFDDIARLAKQHGIRGVHIRTELLVDRTVLDRLLQCGVDVVSVDLNADRAATYQQMMGLDRFKDVLLNIDYLVQNRIRLTSHPGATAFALPWIVPCLQRCTETYEDIDSFFDRWQHTLGCAVIEGLPPFDTDEGLAPALTPQHVLDRDGRRTMTIFCDGAVPHDPWDWACRSPVGNAQREPLTEIWSRMRRQSEPRST